MWWVLGTWMAVSIFIFIISIKTAEEEKRQDGVIPFPVNRTVKPFNPLREKPKQKIRKDS